MGQDGFAQTKDDLSVIKQSISSQLFFYLLQDHRLWKVRTISFSFFAFYSTLQEPGASGSYHKMVMINTCLDTKKHDSSKHIFKCFALQLE